MRNLKSLLDLINKELKGEEFIVELRSQKRYISEFNAVYELDYLEDYFKCKVKKYTRVEKAYLKVWIIE